MLFEVFSKWKVRFLVRSIVIGFRIGLFIYLFSLIFPLRMNVEIIEIKWEKSQ